jgi:hypothetical protein
MDVSGWSVASGYGTVVTQRASDYRTAQTFYAAAGGTTPALAYVRHHNASDGGGGWTAWAQMMLMPTLSTTSFTQSTPFTSYPFGQSRLYFTSSNSAGWDFNGKYGEVVTFRDSADFAKQQWTKHVGGTTADTEFWIRTANTASGWSKWRIIADDQADTGWINFTGSLPAGYTQTQQCAYRRKNGIVWLRGAFQAPSGGYTQVLTLPTGFRPTTDKRFPITSNTTVSMSATVNASGTINTYTSASTISWFGLDGICFPID